MFVAMWGTETLAMTGLIGMPESGRDGAVAGR